MMPLDERRHPCNHRPRCSQECVGCFSSSRVNMKCSKTAQRGLIGFISLATTAATTTTATTRTSDGISREYLTLFAAQRGENVSRV